MEYTDKAKSALALAAKAARALGQNYIGTEHILLGLMRQQTGIAAAELNAPGNTAQGCRGDICSRHNLIVGFAFQQKFGGKNPLCHFLNFTMGA